MHANVIDLKYKNFGLLKAIEYKGIGKDKYAYWLCNCKCGKSLIVRGVSLTRGHTKSCGCQWHKHGNKSKLWKGYGDISGLYWRNVKQSAKQRNIKFNITIKDAWDLFLSQERKCALTKLDLIFAQKKEDYKKCNASLDRIDSNKGYKMDNIQWVHKTINQMKWELSQNDFIQWCGLVSNNI